MSNRKLLAASAAIVMSTCSFSLAADSLEPLAEGYNWSGIYVGIAGGAGADVHELDFADGLIVFNGIGGEGLFAEGIVGYDYMLSDRLLVGAFADYWFGNSATSIDIGGTELASITAEQGFDIGARIGYLVTPRTLGYVLGGYSQAKYNVAFLGTDVYDWTANGFLVGAGMETMLTDRLTLRGEYRYKQYSSHDFSDLGAPPGLIDLNTSSHTFRVGLNYRFMQNATASSFNAPDHDWTGLYASASVGAGGLVHELGDTGGIFTFNGIGAEGIMGGLAIGYDHQFGSSFVAGVEASGRFGNIATTLALGPNSIDVTADYGFDIVARMGYKPSSNTLIYGLAGYSHQHFDISATGVGSIYDWDANGYTVGGGIETALSEKTLVGLEYRYHDYGDFEPIPGFLNIDTSSHTAKLTFKYKFF
jgi:outer membrane immunogenic protein